MPGCAARHIRLSKRAYYISIKRSLIFLKKWSSSRVTNHNAFVNKKCYGNFLSVYNEVIIFALVLSEQRNRLPYGKNEITG
jgi:hypothetical protein